MGTILKINAFLTVTVLVVVLMPVSAFAQVPPAAPPAGGTLEQRIAQRKTERALALSDPAQKRVTETCVSAQAKMRTLQQPLTSAINNRSATYQQIDGKLWIVIGKLKLAKKDTYGLEVQRTNYANKVSAVQISAENYRQALDDTVVINCQADPVGFKAMLDTARIYRSQVRDQSTDIHAYIVNTIKPSLSSLATDLQNKSVAGQN